MNPAQLAALRTTEGTALLAELTPYEPASAMMFAERLRRDHSADLVAVALTQARLRTRAAERFGPEALRLWWTQESLEQATRPEVSLRRAKRLVAAGVHRVGDLGCGAGMDAIAMARCGLKVLAVERDPSIAEIARANMEALGLDVEVRWGDLMRVDVLGEGLDAVFLDPARRANGARITHPERWKPAFSDALRIATSVEVGVLKVAPGIDRALVPADAELEMVSSGGTLVEATLWFGRAVESIRRRATVLPSGLELTDQDPREAKIPVGPVGVWVVEPDDAVIRSGLVAQAAHRLTARLLDASIAYLSCDVEPPESPLYQRFRVDTVLPFSMKALRAELKARDVGRVEVKKRGFAMEPDEVRRQLKLDRKAPHSSTVLLTRMQGAPTAIVAHRP